LALGCFATIFSPTLQSGSSLEPARYRVTWCRCTNQERRWRVPVSWLCSWACHPRDALVSLVSALCCVCPTWFFAVRSKKNLTHNVIKATKLYLQNGRLMHPVNIVYTNERAGEGESVLSGNGKVAGSIPGSALQRVEVSLSKTPFNPFLLPMSWLLPCMVDTAVCVSMGECEAIL